MSSGRTAFPKPEGPQRQRYVIIDDQHMVSRHFVESRRLSDRQSAVIHISLRAKQEHFFSTDPPLIGLRLKLLATAFQPILLFDAPGRLESYIMTGLFILFVWIAQTRDDIHIYFLTPRVIGSP